MAELVRLERGDDGVAVVTLDNPKVNALSQAVLLDLERVADELVADPPGAVVVTGGDRVFAAGADIGEFLAPGEGHRPTKPSAEIAVLGGTFLRVLNKVAALPRVTIAAISGFALGGGCELALACDLRIASDRARLGQPEILLGIIPGGGGTQRLARLVGPSRAKDIVLSGRQVPADEALAMGLVDRIAAPDDLHAEARAWAAEFAGGPRTVAALAKAAIDDGLDGPLADGLHVEQDAFVASFGTEDAEVGINSFLTDGPGKATFTGR